MYNDAKRRSELRCIVHPLGELKQYKYVVVCANYKGKWLLSQHKQRDTWETQGGHIEQNETPYQAAQRELYEESGVREADILPVCDYFGYDENSHSNGMVFLAKVHQLGDIPDSEMRKIGLFDELPENLTYPNVSPILYGEAEKFLKNI